MGKEQLPVRFMDYCCERLELTQALLFPQPITWRDFGSDLTISWWIPKETCGTGHLLLKKNDTMYWYSYDNDVISLLKQTKDISFEEWNSEVTILFAIPVCYIGLRRI